MSPGGLLSVLQSGLRKPLPSAIHGPVPAARKPSKAAMKKIIAYLAVSADGYIARSDGDVGWLDRPRPPGDYGMGEFYRLVDTVLLGRKTWEAGSKLGQSSFPGKKNYVFSKTVKPPATAGVELVDENPADFAARVRKEKGKDIWMVGGAALIASFLDAGQIDEFILHVIPILLGEGIPLLEPRSREVPLDLLSSRAFPDGVVRLHYAVGSRRRLAPGRERPTRTTGRRAKRR